MYSIRLCTVHSIACYAAMYCILYCTEYSCALYTILYIINLCSLSITLVPVIQSPTSPVQEWTVHIVQGTVNSVQWTVYSVQGTVCSVQDSNQIPWAPTSCYYTTGHRTLHSTVLECTTVSVKKSLNSLYFISVFHHFFLFLFLLLLTCC